MTERIAKDSIKYVLAAIAVLMAIVPLRTQTASVPGAITLESTIASAGHGAARVDLHSHDRFSVDKGGDPDNAT